MTHSEAARMAKLYQGQENEFQIQDLEANREKGTLQDEFLRNELAIAERRKKDLDEAGQKEVDQIMDAYKRTEAESNRQIAELNKDFETFRSEQDGLSNEFESNRLNAVRSQIIQGLAARGIDISKVPPEQLIQLSGDIGAKAFGDIFEKKE